MAAVSLSWDTIMAAVTSCENTLYFEMTFFKLPIDMGGGGFYFSFYSVQDCPRYILTLPNAIWGRNRLNSIRN